MNHLFWVWSSATQQGDVFLWEVDQPENWLVSPSSCRSTEGTKEVKIVGSFGVKGGCGGSASMQVVI